MGGLGFILLNMQKAYFDIPALNQWVPGTLMGQLGIVFSEMGEGWLAATMPVDARTIQPMKILHGGATLALAETVGSGLSIAFTNPQEYLVKGQALSANHLKSAKKGYVKAVARFLHRGKSSDVIDVSVYDEEEELISVIRMINAIRKANGHGQ